MLIATTARASARRGIMTAHPFGGSIHGALGTGSDSLNDDNAPATVSSSALAGVIKGEVCVVSVRNF